MNREIYEIAWTPSARKALSKVPEKVGTAVIEFLYGCFQGWRGVEARLKTGYGRGS